MHAPVDNAELRNSKKQMVSGTYLHNAWYVAAWSDELAVNLRGFFVIETLDGDYPLAEYVGLPKRARFKAATESTVGSAPVPPATAPGAASPRR